MHISETKVHLRRRRDTCLMDFDKHRDFNFMLEAFPLSVVFGQIQYCMFLTVLHFLYSLERQLNTYES